MPTTSSTSNTGCSDTVSITLVDDNVPGAPATIGDTVWMDLSYDGIVDANEPRLVNHSVRLWSTGEDGIPDLKSEYFIYLGDQANMPYGRYDGEGKSEFLKEKLKEMLKDDYKEEVWDQVKDFINLF